MIVKKENTMKLNPHSTALLLVDVQERLFYHMHEYATLEKRLGTLLQGLQLLHIPIFCNQQYTKGLGETIPSLREILGEHHVYEKKTFSCCRNEAIMSALKQQGIENVILAGIETHICVLQTALDCLDASFQTIVCADATASRHISDCEIAKTRFIQEGIRLSSVESLLFELMQSAEHPAFKAISTLVK